MARHASTTKRWRPSGKVTALAVIVVAVLAAATTFVVLESSATSKSSHHLAAPTHPKATTTTTTAPTPTTTTTRPAGPGFNAGHVTAVGDSVMLDYQDPLQTAIPGIAVEAAVSRQWS